MCSGTSSATRPRRIGSWTPDRLPTVLSHPMVIRSGRTSSELVTEGTTRSTGPKRTSPALELAPRDPDVLLTASLVAIDRDDLALARRHLAIALDQSPRDWRMSDALALIERRSGRPKDAADCLRRGIAASDHPEGRSQLRWTLADVLIDQAQWDDARSTIEKLDLDHARPELLGYLRARINAGLARWIGASKELEAIYPLLAAGTPRLAYSADLLLGKCYEQLGDHDRRYMAYRRAVSLDPEASLGQWELARALAALGRLDEALAAYLRLADREPGAGTAAARLMIQRNLHRPARPHDWQEVERVLARAARVTPGSSEVPLLRAEALAAQGQWDHARILLVKARDQRPDQVELWISLVELADRRDTPTLLCRS